MKICLTLDDVIRNKTKAFIKAYNKEKGTDIDPDTLYELPYCKEQIA